MLNRRSLLALPLLAAVPARAQTPEISTDIAILPPRVATMRARIIEACKSGKLEKLHAVMESNEMMPSFAREKEKDPVGYYKRIFPDSEGLEALARILAVMERGFARISKGQRQEMWLWPWLASADFKTLEPEDKVEALRLLTGAEFKTFRETGTYPGLRVGIGPDGTWHYALGG